MGLRRGTSLSDSRESSSPLSGWVDATRNSAMYAAPMERASTTEAAGPKTWRVQPTP